MSSKILNGKRVEMTSQEAAEFNAARVLSLDAAKNQKLLDLDRKAEVVRTGGIVINGGKIKTTDGAVARLLGTNVRQLSTRNVKVGMGKFVPMASADIKAIQEAVHDFIQACYDREAVLSAQILAATSAAEVDAIDIDAGWPA